MFDFAHIHSKKELLPLASSALPVTVMRATNSTINSLVSIILPLRLVASGLSSNDALSQFGATFGMSMPLLFIPTTLISSFILVLVPELSENYYKGQNETLKKNILKAIKISVFVACLFIPVFIAVGKEIGVAIYNNPVSGKYLTEENDKPVLRDAIDSKAQLWEIRNDYKDKYFIVSQQSNMKFIPDAGNFMMGEWYDQYRTAWFIRN